MAAKPFKTRGHHQAEVTFKSLWCCCESAPVSPVTSPQDEGLRSYPRSLEEILKGHAFRWHRKTGTEPPPAGHWDIATQSALAGEGWCDRATAGSGLQGPWSSAWVFLTFQLFPAAVPGSLQGCQGPGTAALLVLQQGAPVSNFCRAAAAPGLPGGHGQGDATALADAARRLQRRPRTKA